MGAGVSRSVRTPSRAEQGGTVLTGIIPNPPSPPFFPNIPLATFTQGNPNLRSEEVIAYEVGYRTTFSKTMSLDLTGFYNDYRDLRGVFPGTPSFTGTNFELPIALVNSNSVKTYGIEVATVWQMLDWWRWDLNYSWLHTQLTGNDRTTPVSPEQRASLRGALSPWKNIDMDFWFRYVDANFTIGEFGAPRIKPYVTLDLRLAWRPHKNLELSLVGQNLLAQKHLEYIQENQTLPTGIDRGMYGKVSWGF
ncbi:TonB-dependent receptor [Methyloglobulus sp.]|uniref:TonB-dependent receptor plug domain-containing protein n=1 Tax=Methyloglobulus sp. TaxID=2518622 RepID=UPI0032B765CF